jgi:hypothetical protein
MTRKEYMANWYQQNKAERNAKNAVHRKKWGNGNGRTRVLEHARASRARRRVAESKGDHILITDLYTRDEGLCRLCLEPCALEDASIDHIIPISKSGEHIWANVQLAHLQCNRLKGAKMPTTKTKTEIKIKEKDDAITSGKEAEEEVKADETEEVSIDIEIDSPMPVLNDMSGDK